MSKSSKLGKLKCTLRRWHSSSSSSSSSRVEPEPEHEHEHDGISGRSKSFPAEPSGYQPVYVGRSRRRFLVSAELAGHPLFRNLLESSSPPLVVGCEVVLFEHMLWMLENADPKPESLDEIVHFYAC